MQTAKTSITQCSLQLYLYTIAGVLKRVIIHLIPALTFTFNHYRRLDITARVMDNMSDGNSVVWHHVAPGTGTLCFGFILTFPSMNTWHWLVLSHSFSLMEWLTPDKHVITYSINRQSIHRWWSVTAMMCILCANKLTQIFSQVKGFRDSS